MEPSNLASLEALRTQPKIKNPQLHFIRVGGASHFSLIVPVVTTLSRNITNDGPQSSGFKWESGSPKKQETTLP
jgi:hypothetical protein